MSTTHRNALGLVGPLALLAACWLCAPGRAAAAAQHSYGTAAALEEEIEAFVDRSGDWVAVGPGAVLRRGDRGERVARLRRSLAASRDLDADRAEGDRFDAATARAVERFQARHALEADGLVGPATRAALDEPPARRLSELERNLAAMRAFEAKAEVRYVLVNVPDFHLAWIEPGQAPLIMRVAVGEQGWATPPIDDRIDRLELNPSWHLPASIVAKELAPKVQADSDYLREQKIEVLDGWGEDAKPVDPDSVDWNDLDPEESRLHVVQHPGPDNPLGRIKFVFPNREEIYLHDTPDRTVFDQRERDASHGCIRVEEPIELATRLVEGTGDWDRDRLERTIDSGETVSVALAASVPIHLVYWTAWVDGDGVLQIRKDLYGDEVDPDSPPL